MYIDVSLGFMRSIASWKPFTVKAGDGLPALSNVNMFTTDKDGAVVLVTQVTDRYRILHRSDYIGKDLVTGAMGDDKDGTVIDVLIPMDLIVQFVTATRAEKYPKGIKVRISADDDFIIIEGASSRVSSVRPKGQYPKVAGLLGQWVINDNPVGTIGLDVGRVADFTKLVSPSDGKKYATAWKFEQGTGSDPKKSGSYRVTNAGDEALTALFMPLMNGF